MSNVIWKPLEGSQTLALSCPANVITCHGSRGGGKSDVQLMRYRMRVGQGYGRHWRGVIFDREYKNLDDLVSKSLRWFPQFRDGARFLSGKSDYKWVWPTGEELMFRTLKKESDYWNYHGQEFSFIGINEITKYPNSSVIDMIMSCNRSSFRPEDHPIYIDGRHHRLYPDMPLVYVPETHKYAEERYLPELPLEMFITTNPFGCVPYGEVLTETRGWVDIKDINQYERVLSCDKDGTIKYCVVTGKTIANWDKGLYSVKGRGIEMVFTENHRFPHFNTKETEHVVKHFKDLPNEAWIRRKGDDWVGTYVETLHGFDAGDFMELLGWFISEGCMITRKDGSERNSFQISQVKEHTRAIIESLLVRMGVRYRKDWQCFVVTNSTLAAIFRGFGNQQERCIPNVYLTLSKPLLERLHKSLMLGDGSGNTYYTTSKLLADSFCELCIKLSITPHVGGKLSDGTRKEAYWVTQQKTSRRTVIKHKRKSNTNVKFDSFEGAIYCLTVPETETFFIRQGGCIWLSGNCGHNWVKKRYISVAPAGKIHRTVTNVFNPRTGQREDIVKTQVHLFSSFMENKYLNPEYVATLEAIEDPNKRKAWLGGSWDIVSGGMFDDVWDTNEHVISASIENIPSTWRIDRSFDWGSSKPFSVGWWAESDGSSLLLDNGQYMPTLKGDLFRIAEWYGCTKKPNEGLMLLDGEIALGIIEREINMGIYGRVNPGPADNAIWNLMNGNSTALEMQKPVKIGGRLYKGVEWARSNKSPGSRVQGWLQIRNMLKASGKQFKKEGSQYSLDESGKKIRIPRENPGLFFFSNCVDAINLLPTLPRDEKNPDDVDTDSEDHIGDEVRYRCLAVGTGATGGKTKGLV